MNTTTQSHTSEIIKELKELPHITVGSEIKIIGTSCVVGVNVHASSTIRKEYFTRQFVQEICKKYGFTFIDKYPNTTAMQIIF